MRLLFVSHSLPPEDRPLANLGGMQRVALKLHESLDRKADAADALSYDALLLRSAWRTLHAKVPFFLAKAGWKIGRAAQNDAVDVVLFSSMVTASLAVPLQGLLHRHGVQTAAIVHGLDVTTPFAPYQWFVPKVFDALDGVLPVSRATQQACLDRGAAPEQIQVVHNGIDVDRFPKPRDRATDRRALDDRADAPAPPPPPEALLLCSVGRQVERKGTAWFVDTVMPRLPDDVHYWIAGDGPQSSAIQEAIDRHNLSSRVRHLGRVSNEMLSHLYRGADLFVMPNVPVENDMEGFGIVLLEAGQCGAPAIAARLEGIRDVITEDVNGHLVSPQDPGAFVDAIAQYRTSPESLDVAARG
ncbi:MAG: glycosyltransferase family 4 protein [Bacteroidetes bacterium QS_1_63_11]|nr:MAG: glycosyltransferase family 4 protein [Bacteroidetes bacterium QS_1_63_11]